MIKDDDHIHYDEFLYLDDDVNFRSNISINQNSEMQLTKKFQDDFTQQFEEDVLMKSNFDQEDNDHFAISTIRSDWQGSSDTRLALINDTEMESSNSSKNDDSVLNWKLQKKKLDEDELAEVETCDMEFS